MAGLDQTFAELRQLMLGCAGQLPRATDAPDHLYLNTPHLQANKKPLFFGAVQIKKKAVSYHLMPLYTHPELASSLSPALRKHMQGKSCFNFTAADPALVRELAALTRAGYEQYRKAGYI